MEDSPLSVASIMAGEFSSIVTFVGYNKFSAKFNREPAKKSGLGKIAASFGTTWKISY